MQRGPRIFKRQSRIYKAEVSEQSWVDEVECRDEELFKVKPEQMKEVMHRNIGAITFTHPNKNPLGTGTGFLISENLVLTCAHNIYDRKEKVYYLDLKFYPGVCGELNNPYEAEDYRFPEEFISEKSTVKSIIYDYAIIKLKRPVKSTSFLILAVGFNDLSEAIAVFGYPGHKYQNMNKTATLKSVNQYGLELPDRVTMSSEDKAYKRILYQITTYPGQSGCPIIIGKDLHNKVVAIHKGGNQTLQKNYGRLITLDLLIDIQIWREEMNGSSFKAIDLRNSIQISFIGTMFEDAKDKVKAERGKRTNGAINMQAGSSQSTQLLEENCSLKSQLNDLKLQASKLMQENQKLRYFQGQLQNQIVDQKQLLQISQNKSTPFAKKTDSSEKKTLRSLKTISFEPSQLSQLSIKKQVSDSPPQKYPFQWDANSPFAGKFFMIGSRATLRDFGTYQVVSARSLRSPLTISFRVVKYGGDKQIGFGIVTGGKKCKMYSGALGDDESVGFWSYNKYKEGEIFVNGKKEVQWTANLHLQEAYSILNLELDLHNLTVNFSISPQQFQKEFKLTDNFRNKQVFAFACMKEKGDTIEVLE